ncbi:hypothetical protein GCM10023063_20180 [Arthrobacter methylotrophus]|uniref:Uncharacterized protein n=1 Tax=Arthrobacter methylotrophus TaxID=121291 RepID=A0ABV5UXQ6_9MICC
MTAFSRIEAAKSTATLRVSDAFKNEAGAFDLPSILVGVVVVGILTAGVLASIFGVIPFAQDKGAQQDLGSVVTAEGVFKAQTNNYTDLAGLQAPAANPGQAGNLISSSITSSKMDVESDHAGQFAAATKSGSGKVFYVTDGNSNPIDASVTAPAAGSLAATAIGKLA